MSPSLLTSTPLSSIDVQGLRAGSDPSRQNTKQMSTETVDVNHLSAYSTYLSNSNSVSPSTFSTPAEQTSENSCFSEYDYAGDDEFFGVDFDAGDQVIDAGPIIVEDIPLPTTELPAVEAYLPQQPASATQTYDTTTHSIYLTSSDQSNSPSEPFPKVEIDELDVTTTVPQYEPLKGNPSLQATMSHDMQPTLGNFQRTPDLSPNSHNNGDNVGLGMGHLGHSPRVTITPWESTEETEIAPEVDNQDMEYGGEQPIWQEGVQSHTSPGPQFGGGYDFQPPQIAIPRSGIVRDEKEDEYFDFDEVSGRIGIDPDRRKSLSDIEIPNLKEQEESARLRLKNREVEEWRSQAGDSADADEENQNQSRSSLSAPSFDTRPRASTTGAIPHSAIINFGTAGLNRGEKPEPAEGEEIEPVSDTESVRENQLKDGETYVNVNATTINDGDRELLQRSRHWNDGPAYPLITDTKTQAPTANDAMRRWNQTADNFSMLSRSATWGTRRRSEPSIADMESINNGSFLKRLSFKTGKEKRPGIFKESLDTITNMVQRKRSDSKLKRSRSGGDSRGRSQGPTAIKKEDQSKLAPPPGLVGGHRRGASSPRLDTRFVHGNAPSHARSGSASATSPKGLSSFVNSAIRRVRSGSSLQQDPSKSGLAGLWKAESGGPPVPTLASPPMEVDAIKQQDYSDAEGEDDDEDEPADEGEMMDFDPAIPITPNFNGFYEHVRQLYPQMEPNYLVERIAHQQVVRYKALLGWRVKHSGAIANQNCAAGSHCIVLGGSATLLEPKNQPRDNDMSNSGLQIMTDISDGDSNPEGALAAESFPQGVPMPPTTTLPAEFECQLCFRVKKFQKPSDWTKHVHEDVQPFTCTYPNCKEPKSFKRKADWVRHENERHRRLTWWTCQVEDCTHRCYRKDNFLQHLVREHKIPEPKQKSKSAAKKARNSDEAIWVMIRNCHHETTAKPQDEPCKFCGKVLNTWKKLTVHLAKHMEGISLSVLRLVEQQHVDANTIISPVEALPIRQTPVTPIGGDRRLSNSSGQYGSMSSSISPNTQSIPHFSSPGYPQTSPNVQTMPQFQGNMYNQNMGYNTTTTQDMSPYTVQAPINQSQQTMMFDNRGMPYSSMNQISPYMSSTSSRGFSAMDQSPSIDQSSAFAINGSFTPIQQQHGYHSGYASSNPTLSPDPSAPFVSVSAPQQMPGFQSQPNQASFVASPHQGPGYAPHQQMLGMGDEGMYDSGLGPYDQAAMMRAQQQQGGNNMQYPSARNNTGYGYHGHGQ